MKTLLFISVLLFSMGVFAQETKYYLFDENHKILISSMTASQVNDYLAANLGQVYFLQYDVWKEDIGEFVTNECPISAETEKTILIFKL